MSTETIAAARTDDHRDFFGGPDDAAIYGKHLADKFGKLWEKVCDKCPIPENGDVWERDHARSDRYLTMACKLCQFAAELMDDAGHAEDAREEFADALTEAVDVRCHLIPQEHRGPYVPGGVYRETLVEVEIVDDQVGVDLSPYDHIEFIPRTITAPYSGSSGGQDFDLTLQFDLLRVSAPREDYPQGEAVYSVFDTQS